MDTRNKPIQLGVLENNKAVSTALHHCLTDSQEFSIEFCSNGLTDFCGQIQRHAVEIALTDLDGCSLKTLHQLIELFEKMRTSARIVLITQDSAEALFFRGIPEKLSGCIHATHLNASLLPALLNAVCASEQFVTCPMISTQMATVIKRQMLLSKFESLSEREGTILHYLANGYQYKEISAMLCTSLNTIRSHIQAIYRKLQVNTKQEAIQCLEGRESKYFIQPDQERP